MFDIDASTQRNVFHLHPKPKPVSPISNAMLAAGLEAAFEGAKKAPTAETLVIAIWQAMEEARIHVLRSVHA